MTLTIIFIFVSAFIFFVLPTLAAVVMIVKRKANWTMFLLGVVSFSVSQLLIRLPLLGELQNAVWFNMFVITQPFLYAMLLALTAGIFEETGRFAAIRFLNKGLLTWENGVIFGLGHGGVEAFCIVGIPFAKQILSAVSAGGAAVFAGSSPFDFLIPGVERLLAIVLHIGFTMLVLYAVKRRNIWFFILAVLAHALIDAVSPLIGITGLKLNIRAYIWLIEGALAVFAILALIIIIKMRAVLRADAGKDVL